MTRFGLAAALTMMCFAALANTPDDYAWGWSLQTNGNGNDNGNNNVDSDAAAWRVRLQPGIVRKMVDAEARDLAVFDAEGRPMPLLRVPPARLVEVQRGTRALRFETRAHRDRSRLSPENAAGDDGSLSLLLLRPDGTRLELSAPESDPVRQGSTIVYEALIEGPAGGAGIPARDESGHWLLTEWSVAQPVGDSLDCRLKPVDRPDVHAAALEFETAFDSRPAAMTARTRVAPGTRGWHLSCRSSAPPPGLELRRASIEWRRNIDHVSRVEIQLPFRTTEAGGLEGRIEHPYALKFLRVSSPARNQISTVRLLLRSGPDEDWRQHAEVELSTLDRPRVPDLNDGPRDRKTGSESAGQAVFDLQRQPLRRLEWRVESAPPLAEPVTVLLEANVEEWLFLAQGHPPWRLYAGSRQASPRNPALLAESTLARLAPAWKVPLASPGDRFEAGGVAALKIPTEPLPWKRAMLWLILVGGTLVVAWLALRMLRIPG